MSETHFRGYSESVPLIRTADGTATIDLESYANGVVNDPLFLYIYGKERDLNPEQFDKNFKERLKQNINPTVIPLRPTANDPTICYAIMEPRGNIPRLCIRFWYGLFDYFGYNFDLVDLETKSGAVFAPNGLSVQYFQDGTWQELMSTTQAMRQCVPIMSKEEVPPKWQMTPGTLIRFCDQESGLVVGEVSVPNAPIGENPRYECFSEV